jgi:hypothetical protein
VKGEDGENVADGLCILDASAGTGPVHGTRICLSVHMRSCYAESRLKVLDIARKKRRLIESLPLAIRLYQLCYIE